MATKQQSPSSSSSLTSEKSSDLGKICFICYCAPDGQLGDFSFGHEPSRINHCLFILDLDAEESSDYVPVNPTLCFDSVRLGVAKASRDFIRRGRPMDHTGVLGFCVLGSKLYLFGRGKKDVFSYELPCSSSVPSLSSPLELTDDMLNVAPCMNSPKHYPVGCQTPDGKMLVFSTKFDVTRDGDLDFELFDPAQGRWNPLADLRPLLRGPSEDFRILGRSHRFITVWSYSFIDNRPVLLITTPLGKFALDTENNVWSKLEGFKFPSSSTYHEGDSMLVMGRFRLMDRFAWVDGTKSHEWLPYPRDKRSSGSTIAWLSSSSSHFCVVRSYVDATTLLPHLIIDVAEFDSRNDNLDDLKLKKTFKFVVGYQRETFFPPRSIFSIP